MRIRSSAPSFFADSGDAGFPVTHGSNRIFLPPGERRRNVAWPSQVMERGIGISGYAIFLRPRRCGCKRVPMHTTHVVIGAFLVTLAAPSMSPHHSFAAEFDANKPVLLTGAVTQIEWTN